MQILDENAVQEFMNEIKSLLRRTHKSPSRLILPTGDRGVPNSGFFESRENEGIHEAPVKPIALLKPPARYLPPNSLMLACALGKKSLV